MTFYEWLSKQRDRPDPVGDVARDVHADGTFPESEVHRSLAHLQTLGVPEDILEEVRDEYLKQSK